MDEPVHTPPAVKGLNIGLLLLRLSLGGMMLSHGLPKLNKLLAGSTEFADPLGLGPGLSLLLAVGAEVGCSLLLMLGLFSRLATLPLMFTMLVAILVVHGDDPFGKKELPLMYLSGFGVLLLTGPGAFSLDNPLWKAWKTRQASKA